MTETSPSHLDLDTLADVLAGEADGSATGHLDACASCTSRLAELAAAEERVVATLSALPPPAVPDDLADRLTAALAAEAPLEPRRSTVTALPERAKRSRSWLPAAAAAVLLVSGAGLGYALLEGPRGTQSADSAAGAATDDLVLNASGTDYADAAAVTDALPGVLAGTAGDVELEPASARAGEARARAGEAQRQAGGAGGGATTEESSGDAMSSAEAPDASLTGNELERLRTPEALTDCLAALLPPEEPETRPLALDYASYAGQPALAVVLPDPDPAKLSVFVVGPGCSRADDSLLHFFRIDAP